MYTISYIVNFYNAGVVTRDRKIGSKITFKNNNNIYKTLPRKYWDLGFKKIPRSKFGPRLQIRKVMVLFTNFLTNYF
jgi:hypothetical protein